MKVRTLVSLLLFSMLIGCAGPAVSPTDQALITQGDQLHSRLEPALIERQNPRLKRYFEQIGGRIVAAAKELDQQSLIRSTGQAGAWMFSKEIDFHLIDSELPNSFTTGGHHVYVYSGLFHQCRNEDELAALFCHEYAHIYARHLQQDLKRDPSLTGDAALFFPYANLRISPAQGRSADSIAFSIYAKAGWDPGRFASLHQRLLEQGGAGVDRTLLKEKVIEAQRRADDLPPAAREWAQPPVADDSRFAQLQAETRTATVSLNEKTALLLAAFPSSLNLSDTPIQIQARERLFPAPQGPSENKWGKGLPGK